MRKATGVPAIQKQIRADQSTWSGNKNREIWVTSRPPSAAPPEMDGAAKAALGGQQAMITFPLRRSAAETLGITRTH